MRGLAGTRAEVIMLIAATALIAHSASAKAQEPRVNSSYTASSKPFRCPSSVQNRIVGSWRLVNEVGEADEIRFDRRSAKGYTFSAWNENRPDGNGRWHMIGCKLYIFNKLQTNYRLFELRGIKDGKMTLLFEGYTDLSVYELISR